MEKGRNVTDSVRGGGILIILSLLSFITLFAHEKERPKILNKLVVQERVEAEVGI